MIQSPRRLGAPRAGIGCLFVVVTDPHVLVQWSASHGSLTPVHDFSDGGGRAMARWAPGGTSSGTVVTVTVTRRV